jgi:hypothetical protein
VGLGGDILVAIPEDRDDWDDDDWREDRAHDRMEEVRERWIERGWWHDALHDAYSEGGENDMFPKLIPIHHFHGKHTQYISATWLVTNLEMIWEEEVDGVSCTTLHMGDWENPLHIRETIQELREMCNGEKAEQNS